MNRMIAITVRPGAVTAALRPIAPLLLASTTAAPAPASTRKNVPMASEKSRRHWRCGSSNSAREPNSRAYQARARLSSCWCDSGVGVGSDAGLCSDTALLDGLLECGVVELVLVRVRFGEPGERAVEDVALAEVGGDRDRVPRAGVRLGQRPAAETPVLLEGGRRHRLDRRAPLLVPELPDVEVVRDALRVFLANPAEKDVGRSLDQALSLDDALAVVREGALSHVRLQHRGDGLLRLQEERVVVVSAEH